MSREIQELPPAPRHPRWRAVACRRLPLAIVGFLLTVYGGAWILMLFFAQAGKPRDDRLLDRSARRTPAWVVRVEPVRAWIEDVPAVRVEFRYVPDDGVERTGACFAPEGRFRPGTTVPAEYLPGMPHKSRLVGGRISLLGDWVTPGLRLTVFPGLLLLLLWLQSVIDLRRMMTWGDAAVAEVLEVRPVRHVLPEMLAVRYRFRDHHARPREGRHWVRRRSTLGRRLENLPARVAVLHSRARPEHSRLVLPEDFVRTPDLRLEEEIHNLI